MDRGRRVPVVQRAREENVTEIRLRRLLFGYGAKAPAAWQWQGSKPRTVVSPAVLAGAGRPDRITPSHVRELDKHHPTVRGEDADASS